jgi:pimeloyl-ACP methyl ester carboxylesterase
MMYYFRETPIKFNCIGEGPVLLFLHGFLESSSMWKNIALQFSASYTILTVDLLGHGKSGVHGKSHTMELQAQMIKGLLDHLQIEEVTLIGHSMGGYIALAFAEAYPSHLKKLVLVNSTAQADSAERINNRKRAIKIIERTPTAFISMAISNLFTSEGQDRFAGEIDILKKEALQFPFDGIQANIRGMIKRKDRTSILQTLSVPTYMIYGTQDLIVSSEAIQEQTKDTEVTLIPTDSGHMSWLEEEDNFVKTLHFIV